MLALLAALAVPALAQDAPTADPSWSRIVNGEVVKGDAFPAAVALGFDFGRYRVQMCSGSLITPRLVLTAGHCTRELAKEYGVTDEQIVQYMRVFFGNDVNSPNVRSVALASVHVHKDYVNTSGSVGGRIDNDINVLELAEDVDGVEPVWFREQPVKTPQIGDEVTSVGFGVTSSDRRDQDSNGIKRSAELILSDVDSSFLYSDARANPGHTNICSGDSGGPQYAKVDGRWEQWGVHSYGFGVDGTDLCLQASASTNVGSYAAFVWNQVHRVHGDDYVPLFADVDYCEERGMYLDRHCDPGCAEPDDDCAIDADGDGHVSDAELADADADGDGTVTADEAEHPSHHCDDTGGAAGGALLAALSALGLRRRNGAAPGRRPAR